MDHYHGDMESVDCCPSGSDTTSLTEKSRKLLDLYIAKYLLFYYVLLHLEVDKMSNANTSIFHLHRIRSILKSIYRNECSAPPVFLRTSNDGFHTKITFIYALKSSDIKTNITEILLISSKTL